MYKTKNLFKYLNYIIFFIFICICFNFSIFGIGSIKINGEEYYEIYNEDDLFEFAKIVNGCSKYSRPYPNLKANAILRNDIHVNEPYRSWQDPDSRPWIPIACDYILNKHSNPRNATLFGGHATNPLDRGYEGTFDGNNHTISNLHCISETSDNVGFFGKIGRQGTVRNLTIKNSYFSGVRGKHSAGLICAHNIGTIQNCFVIMDLIDLNQFSNTKSIAMCSVRRNRRNLGNFDVYVYTPTNIPIIPRIPN